MDYSTRRPPLRRGRRIYLSVNLSPDTLRELAKLCGGNRSAAIEELVRQHVERLRTPTPDAVT